MINALVENQNPIRVMIVDDHKAIVWGLERLIESAQPRMKVVGTANSCAGMLSSIGSVRPDVILLDLDLNGEISLGSLPDLLHLSDGQVLILTGDRNPNTHKLAIMKGARGVIGKDESAESLLHAIERVHAGEVWINRTLMGKVLSAISSGAEQDSQSDPEATRIASLTPRERDIVRAMVQNRGDKSQAIAEVLHISEHTLRNHLTTIYSKLGARNRLDLFAYATNHGIAA